MTAFAKWIYMFDRKIAPCKNLLPSGLGALSVVAEA